MAFPMRRLIDVARRPSVETGASVPGYSGGFAACRVISCLDSEATLHRRVPPTSIPPHPAVFLQNTPILSDPVLLR